MEEEEPRPISIMAMTAAMPMMIPRQVSIDRMTLRRSACNAMRRIRHPALRTSPPVSPSAMAGALALAVFVSRLGRLARPSSTIIAVFDANDALGVPGHVFIVGDDDDGDPFLLVELLNIFKTSSVVRESRLPVGSSANNTGGLVDQRAGDGDALLLAAGKLRRLVIHPVSQAHQSQQPPRLGRGIPCRKDGAAV